MTQLTQLFSSFFCLFFLIIQSPKVLAQSAKNTLIGQVTSVSQLEDVQPTDWAFRSLQSLVERYGVIEAFYNFPFSDRLRVTPLIQVITNPANQEANGTIITGTLRTVFLF
jgi:carbohydrate-selective porin OprB